MKSKKRNITRTGPIKATKGTPTEKHSKRGRHASKSKKQHKKDSTGKVSQRSKTTIPIIGSEGDLSVVIYHRVEQGARHWSLFSRSDGNRGTFYEAAGPLGRFIYQEIDNYEITSQNSNIHELEIPVACVHDYGRYVRSVSETPM